MRVTIENINNKQCTVIRKPFDAEWVKEQLAMGNSVWADYTEDYTVLEQYGKYICLYQNAEPFYGLDGEVCALLYDVAGYSSPMDDKHFDSTLTTLPALPKHPKPEDAPLLYRYMAEGLEIHGEFDYYDDREIDNIAWHMSCNTEITHATLNGERVEIAIREGE